MEDIETLSDASVEELKNKLRDICNQIRQQRDKSVADCDDEERYEYVL